MALGLFTGLNMAAASAATAAYYSPTVRRSLRQGAVYGMAGFLIARDLVSEWLTDPTASGAPEPPVPGDPDGPVHDSHS